jgi:HlyD family secretion protein
MKKAVIAVLVVLGIGAAAWWHAARQPALAVWVSAVAPGLVEETVSNTRAGTITACRRSKLSMPIGGVVDKLLVKEGAEVSAGQLLLELWNLDRHADLAMAEATWQAARHERERTCLMSRLKQRNADRLQQLEARKLTSREAVDNSVTEAQSQQRACDAARDQEAVADARREFQRAVLERTQLRAPFAGIVATINGEVGEYVTPSPPGVPTPPAVDLIDYGCLYVTAPIDEVDAGRLRPGLPVRVTLDAFPELALDGEVKRIAPYVQELEKQARTVDVEVSVIEVPEGVNLLVGYSADITVLLERRENVLRIPTEALLPGQQVWVLEPDSGTLRRRQLRIGIGNWSFTEVVDGLVAQEQVVNSPDQPEIAEGVSAVAAAD